MQNCVSGPTWYQAKISDEHQECRHVTIKHVECNYQTFSQI